MTDENETHEAKPHFGGLPYGPEIVKLNLAFPDPKYGDEIAHEELERVVGLKRRKNSKIYDRYTAIINSWRNGIRRERGIDSDWIRGIGLKFLSPDEKLLASENGLRKGIRITAKSFRRMFETNRDELSEPGKKRYDHQIQVAGRLYTHALNCRKELAINLPAVTSAPKASSARVSPKLPTESELDHAAPVSEE